MTRQLPLFTIEVYQYELQVRKNAIFKVLRDFWRRDKKYNKLQRPTLTKVKYVIKKEINELYQRLNY